ncbi:dipeptidase [Sphingosinicella microcystinivorans]|uniref:Membrane dipeptidase n=1 Tax=Sphingosinicella microcystinivorans TaxID=335406 RepID=A0AAD1D280_SPHMI|nr:membrane dipeptidase [Sphingosinicella microcystinivorans]RKS88638.1 membrane dipeptidase [Sphingosinicella microcystinivorans]BBE32385.1 membrane dipeptidase [Sphingosinicella microcystinivorans]
MTAANLIESSLVWDNHGCMPLRPFDEEFLPQLKRYRDAGVNVAILNIGCGEQGIEDHVRVLAAFRRWLKDHPADYVIVETVSDIEQSRADGKLAVAFDIEGANGIADQPSLLGLYYDLGVRWMLMAYNRNNRVGGGCHDEDGGLTDFGREVLDEMAKVGMVACCTHTGYRTAMDVMSYSSRPVIFSHSNARAVHDHPRNITDEQMKACAATGGVVGINGIGIFLGANDNSPEAYVRHLDHAVQLIGPDHVGIGLDYVFDQQELDDYVRTMAHTFPKGMGYEAGVRMVAPEAIEPIVERLVKLGYSDAVLRAVLGENFLRVAREVWR